MKKFWILGLLAGVLVSCTNGAENSREPEDSSTVSDSEEIEAPEIGTSSSFKELFYYLESQDTAFTKENFEETVFFPGIDTLPALPIEEKRLQQFYPFLVYNADSSLAIDPYSYNHIFIKRGNTTSLTMGSPDTEVALVDFKTKKRQRLLFFGPSYMLLDLKWKDKHTILLAVGEMIDMEKTKPEIWEMDLKTFTKKVAHYSDTLTVDMDKYREQKLVTRGG